MKALSLLFLSLSIIIAQAGFDIPKGVYTIKDLDTARAKAANENLPVVLVLTDTSTT